MKHLRPQLLRSRAFNTTCCSLNRNVPLPSNRLQPLITQRIDLTPTQRTTKICLPTYHPLPSFYTSQTEQPPPKTTINKEEESITTNKKNKHKEDRKNNLRENIYTIPNVITLSRILICPILSYTISNDLHLLSNFLLFYCGVSDWLDGKLARMFPDKMGSVLGSILDPAADKILMTTLVLSLSFKNLLPLPLGLIIIGRDLLLSLSSFYFRYQSLPNPKTFSRFWDLSLPSAQVKPTLISKYNTFLQLLLVGLTTITPILPMDTSSPLLILQWVVAVSTISSGFSYLFSKNAVRYIH